MTYAEKVRYIREKLFFTQEALAKELGVNITTVNRWEKGHIEPSFPAKKALHELCRKNGINIE